VARREVVIVGAGPAGCAAGITLARSGRPVVLVDKARFPRDKFCGDGLTADALRRLADLGLQPASVASWREVDQIMLRSPGGRVTAYPLPSGQSHHSAVARRLDLDAALVEVARAAGVRVVEGAALTAARPDLHGVGLTFSRRGEAPLEVEADHVIGADGMWSPLRKLLGVDQPGYRGEWHAFRQYWCDVTGPAADQLWVSFEPDLLPGYFWSFPLADGSANVGFGIRRGGRVSTHDMAALWPELLARPHLRHLLGADARPESPHRAWPIPAALDERLLTDGRVLFVGDAAAATDPMTGEGIGQALATGTWAAEAILAGADGPVGDRSGAPELVADHYRARVARDLAVDHRLAAALSRVLASPRSASTVLAATGFNDWTRRNFARWLFEDYPRAILGTPRRWHRGMLRGDGPSAPSGPAGTRPGALQRRGPQGG
jgi:menaquinone-9 beta-reductase